MSGKIGTLFEDSAKTTPLYPRTKLSAVSDQYGNTLENNTIFIANNGPEASAGLDASSLQGYSANELIDTAGTLQGIDTSNVLASVNYTASDTHYTATEDCIVCFLGNYYYTDSIRIDNVSVRSGGDGGNNMTGSFIPLKKGQKLSLYTGGGNYPVWYKAFGIKR